MRAQALSVELRAAGDLSPLQQGYQDFFKDKLDQAGADSPADLSEEDKSKFFNHIEKTWPDQKEKIMTQASVALAGLHKQNDTSYLLKLTSTQSMPTRSQIVGWCKKNGLEIDAAAIHVRSNVVRVTATAGQLKIKPQAGLMAALQDYSPEYLLAEVGDKLSYAHHGIRATGVVQGYNATGLIVANDLTNELNDVPLTALLKVQGYKVEEAQAISATTLAAKSMGLVQ
jgi:hypothetical protein